MDVIAAIDPGTTSTLCILFAQNSEVVGASQIEHRQIYPSPGWVEHDPVNIWENTCKVVQNAIDQSKLEPEQIKTIGIATQLEIIPQPIALKDLLP